MEHNIIAESWDAGKSTLYKGFPQILQVLCPVIQLSRGQPFMYVVMWHLLVLGGYSEYFSVWDSEIPETKSFGHFKVWNLSKLYTGMFQTCRTLGLKCSKLLETFEAFRRFETLKNCGSLRYVETFKRSGAIRTLRRSELATQLQFSMSWKMRQPIAWFRLAISRHKEVPNRDNISALSLIA